MTFAAIYKIQPKSTILRVKDSWIIYKPCMLYQSWIWRILFLSRSFISFRIRATLYRSSWNLDKGTWREKQQLSVTVLQIRVLHLPKHRIRRPFIDIKDPIPSYMRSQTENSLRHIMRSLQELTKTTIKRSRGAGKPKYRTTVLCRHVFTNATCLPRPASFDINHSCTHFVVAR